jgi:HTH-type transcriptional regulator / antitoxin HipB
MQTPIQKTNTLAQMKDKYIGKVGIRARDHYEYKLRRDVLGRTSQKQIDKPK